MARIFLSLALVLGLAACDGGFTLNPLNWFASINAEERGVALVPPGGWPEDTDHRLLVAQVTAMRIERTTSGAIVRATGLPPRLGYWDAELVPLNDGEPENGVLGYAFRIASPRWDNGTAGPKQRSVEAAAFVSNAALRDIRAITVYGDRNSRTARR